MPGKEIRKSTIFNDPIYGFISIPYNIIQTLIEHKYFQRLRRIKQLGLTHLVYPGAYHTRFQHAMGAMHLTGLAIEVLRAKGNKISAEEAEGVTIAILLHDIGHGPFSHALEKSIVNNVNHEDLSVIFMESLNKQYKGKLSLAIKIFKNKYPKKFLHQLVASQLDMDRLDYLNRDSFFAGVSEGVISSDRIIKMLNIKNDQLVVDAKGIYSIEKFLIARRLMYWQVYLHKTVVSAELLLLKILTRAKYLYEKKNDLFATPSLEYFLRNQVDKSSFEGSKAILDEFANLDDYDILSAIKVWCKHEDKILASLCSKLVNRKLNKVEIQGEKFKKAYIEKMERSAIRELKILPKDVHYYVYSDVISNSTYDPNDDKINVLYKDGTLMDVAKASDHLNISVLSKTTTKYFLCYPKL
ncbi:MAG: phosphohydrolase [Bacteroidetes bacterium]|nr:MAG: phosphohydrolase [Bacteroidota bacterium]